MDNILIYCDKKTARILYIFKYIFEARLSLRPAFTSDQQYYIQYDAPKLTYHSEPLDDSPWIRCQSLLFESNISPQDIEIHIVSNQIYFYKTQTTFEKTTFDLFAATFYLISRYEEYFSDIQEDQHTRFISTQSIAYKNNFLDIPLIDFWIKGFAQDLLKKYPTLNISTKRYAFKATFDIDLAWKYLNKPIYKTIGGLIRDTAKFKFGCIIERIKVLLGLESDAYYSFSEIKNTIKSYRLSPIFFFPTSDPSKYDKNLAHSNQPYQALINDINASYEIGLHPSYSSLEYPRLLLKEKNRLEKISSSKIHKSRFHFLRFKLPYSYQSLLATDIREDYSMGYPDQIGFRASTSHAFPWFDLENNEATLLTVQPFAIMDVSLKNYLNLKPDEALKKCQEIIDTCKSADGQCTIIWHNNSFDSKEWKGWETVFNHIALAATTP